MRGTGVMGRRAAHRCFGRVAAALALAVLALVPGAAAAAGNPGETTSGTVAFQGAEYSYLLHRPASYEPERPAPLVVMVHGCQTTAEQAMRSTLFNDLAEREGFVVLYPDVDAVGRALPGPLNQCWKFFNPLAYVRDSSDPGAIARMTRTVMGDLAIDPERVYLVGTSAGGLMTAVGAAAYPDLYTAVGLVASAGYLDAPCFATGVGIPVELSAQLAFAQMGPRARVVPLIAIGSDADLAFPAACTVKALEQGLRTSNLVLGGSQDGPIPLAPAAVREGQEPGGRAYTVSSFRDPSGCLVGERWIINGMPHAWPGGTTDPKYAGFTDARAPSGAEATWAFLERYRRSDTSMPCAEAPTVPAPPPAAARKACPRRKVTVTLSRGARVRRVRATVGGRRVRTTVRGRRVRLTVPSGPRGAVRVVLRVRRQGRSRVQVVRRTFRRC